MGGAECEALDLQSPCQANAECPGREPSRGRGVRGPEPNLTATTDALCFRRRGGEEGFSLCGKAKVGLRCGATRGEGPREAIIHRQQSYSTFSSCKRGANAVDQRAAGRTVAARSTSPTKTSQSKSEDHEDPPSLFAFG